MRLRLHSSWHDLPASWTALFARAGATDFFLSRPWFEALGATTLDESEDLCIAAVEAGDPAAAPLAILVGCHRERDPAFFGARSFSSLSNHYTLQYGPLLDGAAAVPALVELARGLRARRPRYAVLHLEPIAGGTASLDDLAAALPAAGLVTRRYFRFGLVWPALSRKRELCGSVCCCSAIVPSRRRSGSSGVVGRSSTSSPMIAHTTRGRRARC
jgi:hypothetical protein